MIPISNKDYFEKTAVLRAKQGWKIEEKAEKELEATHRMFLVQVEKEVADLYARYGVEGLLNYEDLKRRLSPNELEVYRRVVQDLHSQIQTDDEELLYRGQYLINASNMDIIDSKMNILEIYGIYMVVKNLEIVSGSLSATYEETYKHTLYDLHRKFGYISTYERLRKEDLYTRIMDSPFGESPAEAIKNQRQMMMRDLKRTITKGIRRNEGYSKLTKGLNRVVSGKRGFNAVKTTLRNETDRVIAESILEPYEQAGVSQYQYLATLDDRTTQVCSDMDRKVFLIDEQEVGINFPPLHFGCRSTVNPYFEEDDLSEWQRIARDRTGQNYKVPGDISYKQWEQQYY